MLWELLAADIERTEGIGAIGTVFEKVSATLQYFKEAKCEYFYLFLLILQEVYILVLMIHMLVSERYI